MIFTILTKTLGDYNGLRHKFKRSKFSIIKKILNIINKGYQLETNSYLPFNNMIKGPINFLHGTNGIFISGGAVIGNNCTMYHQVTIGSNMLIDSNGLGHPTIGNNCLIGAGAKIIGGINIGDNVRIGANTVITKDVSDNSVVVLAAPRIYQKSQLVNRIYLNSPDGFGYLKDGSFVKEKDELILEKLNELA